MVQYNLEGCLKTFRPLARQRDFFGQTNKNNNNNNNNNNNQAVKIIMESLY